MKKRLSLFFSLMILSCCILNMAMAQMYWMRIIQPNGGEILKPGKIYEIKWETKSNGGFVNSNGGTINLYYASFDPKIESTLIAECIPNTGSYNWKVPVIESKAAVVMIQWESTCHGFGLYNWASQSSFIIAASANTVSPTPTIKPTSTPKPETPTPTPPSPETTIPPSTPSPSMIPTIAPQMPSLTPTSTTPPKTGLEIAALILFLAGLRLRKVK